MFYPEDVMIVEELTGLFYLSLDNKLASNLLKTIL